MGQEIGLCSISVIQRHRNSIAVALEMSRHHSAEKVLLCLFVCFYLSFFLIKSAFISVCVHMQYSTASEQLTNVERWQSSLFDASDELI